MIDAKEEFLEHTAGKKILCAIITTCEYYWQDFNTFLLKRNYTELDYQHFLKQINYKYDDGYGSQNLFGTIWYTDGTWSSREEYDGSEWWVYNECPAIPNDLQ